MKRLLVLILSALTVFTLCNSVTAQESAEEAADKIRDCQNYLWELKDDMTDEEFMVMAVRNQKIVSYLQYYFTEESYRAFNAAIIHFKQKREGARQEILDTLNQLEQTASIEDSLLFLWESGNIPKDPREDFTEEELDAMTMEGYGFEPYVMKFLIDDPQAAKGNLIILSGGVGNNETEGYPAVLRFNELGYNCFLLHRRSGDFPALDQYMDPQRAVRVVRNYAAQENLGGQDMLAVVGFSAGGKAILGMLDGAYGYLTPVDEGAVDYEPDDIDLICSDPDVAILIYSANGRAVSPKNTNVPAIFLCVGDEDATANYKNTLKMYDAIKDTVISELFVVEGAGHGFGVGQEGATKSVPECALWPELADEFMQNNLGHSGV